ncbi:MAG: Acetylornithine aminotransferase [Pseudomonadota bacterium]
MQTNSSSLMNVYKRLPVKIVRGQGAWVYDESDTNYLDMYAGHAVTSTGHCHPHVVGRLSAQINKLLFYSNAVNVEHQEEAADLIVSELPAPLNRVFFCNSGAEAVENCLKVARLTTGKKKIVAFEGGFHGRTLGAQAVTGLAKYRQGLAAEIPGHTFVPFNDAKAAALAVAGGDVAAMIVEPIQGLAGCRTADPEFFIALRQICDRHGVLLIFDEMQTGFGRTGSFAFAPRYGVVPDLISFGKGIASGLPVAAVVTTEKIAATIRPGDLGTTFGGGPLACLAVCATIEVLRNEQIYDQVTRRAPRLRAALAALPSVQEVRGEGYLIGIKLDGLAAKLQGELFRQGILVGTSDDPSVLRLMPPLTLSDEQIDYFIERMMRAEKAFRDKS